MTHKSFLALLLIAFFASIPLLAGSANQSETSVADNGEDAAQDAFQAEETWTAGEIPDSLAEFYDYAQADTILRLAVVLSDIYSKKDMEFTRGFLMGMSHANLPANSVSLKVVNGEIPEDSLEYELDLFAPHVIFTTYEKTTPPPIRTQVQRNGTAWVNVFDAKGDDYLYNDNIFQVLAPSDKFNTSVLDYIKSNFEGNVLMLVGEPDPSETIVRDLVLNWPEEDLMIVSKEDLSSFVFEDGVNYLIYPLYTDYDDVKATLKETLRLLSESSSASVKIFGRPNWVSFNDISGMISNMETYIPAKCYFDPSADDSKRFISAYNSMFGHAPIRSYPVYAVMGYDTSRYFLPNFIKTLRTGNAEWNPENLCQSYFDLAKTGWGSYYNRGGYILHYEPWGTLTKDLIE